jgi:hypothetical protein
MTLRGFQALLVGFGVAVMAFFALIFRAPWMRRDYGRDDHPRS